MSRRAPLIDRVAILRPLRVRDFRMLWIGTTVSLLGDGIFPVALAWEVLHLSNSATALALVGVTWSLPQIPLILLAGVVTDRLDRRHIVVAASLAQGVAVLAMALLSLAGRLELWHVFALAVLFGTGEAFFMPPVNALVADVVPQELLVEANSNRQTVRPLAMNFIGPALGGVIVGALGTGWAFMADAVSFVAGAVFVLGIRHRPAPRERTEQSAWADARVGLRYVKERTWLWGAMVAATIVLLVYLGPFEVLIPFIVKNGLHGSAGDLGLVFAAGGLGAIAVSVIVGQRGLPRRAVTFMYVAWIVATGVLAAFALVQNVWQAMLVSAVMNGAFSGLIVVWYTLMQTLVPRSLLGRVSSIDWLISAALVPVSFAITGPIAGAIGARPTVAIAGISGALFLIAFVLLVPGLRDPERDGSIRRDRMLSG
ncbi:MAG: MFS transporter [Actinomycetota bacterium]